MKLFGDFEAVRFSEENLIFITHSRYLYYIYDPKSEYGRKHRNAGNDIITVSNYEDISKEELLAAMGGFLPRKETDFMRLCNPSQLCIRDMLDLLKEDYLNYMSDHEIYHTVHQFLLESDICYISFSKLQKLFGNALSLNKNNGDVLMEIKKLCFAVIGRDIFKREIGIVDGHDSSSYFWIMPVRVVDDKNTNGIDAVAEMKSVEISIEEDDVSQYLTPFLFKYFDDELEANKKRVDSFWEDDAGNEQISYVSGFEWYLTHNFYSFDSITNILKDIINTIDALHSGKSNEFTEELKEKRGTATYKLLYARDLSGEQIDEYNVNRPKKDNTETEVIVDFYRRFIYRMEYMMRVGKEKRYDLISFMGP